MVMEAMRLSLQEHEDAQRRQGEGQSNNREEQTNSGTQQSDNAPAPLSYVLSHPRSAGTRDSTSSSPTSAPAASPSDSVSGTLQPPIAPIPYPSNDSIRRSRTPSPHPDGHRRTPSVLEQLVSGSAVNAGAIAGITRDTANTQEHDTDSNPNPNPSPGPSGSEVRPKDASFASKHEATAQRSSIATSADVPLSYTVLPSTPDAESVAHEPLLPSSPEDRPAESSSTTTATPSSS